MVSSYGLLIQEIKKKEGQIKDLAFTKKMVLNPRNLLRLIMPFEVLIFLLFLQEKF